MSPELPPELVHYIIQLTLPTYPTLSPARTHLNTLHLFALVNRTWAALTREEIFRQLAFTTGQQVEQFLQSTRPVLPDPWCARLARDRARSVVLGSGRWVEDQPGKGVSADQVRRVLARAKLADEVWLWRVLDVSLFDVSQASQIKSLYLFTTLHLPLPLNPATQHRHPNPFNNPRPYFAFQLPTLVRLALIDARASDVSAIVGAPELFPTLRDFVLLDGRESVGAADAPLRMRRTLHDHNPFFNRLEYLVLGGDERSRSAPSSLLDNLYPHALQSATNLRHLTLTGSHLYPQSLSPFAPLPFLETLDIDLDSALKVSSVIISISSINPPGPLPKLKLIRYTIKGVGGQEARQWRTGVMPSLVRVCAGLGIELREVEAVEDAVEGVLKRLCSRLDELQLERATPAAPTASS